MTRLQMAQAKAALSELASRASAGERFLLTRRGKPVAALVAPRDIEAIERLRATQGFVAALERFRKRHAAALPRDPLSVQRSRGRPVR